MTERSDEDLMLALKAGDDGVFALLVNRHRNAVLNLTYRYLGNRSDAEDLSQEVFLKVYRARNRYEPTARFTTWLYRVAVNACLNEVRNRKNRPTFSAASLPGGDGEEAFAPAVADGSLLSPGDAAEQSELKRQVRMAVDELPDRQRLALLLNKFHGLSYDELSKTLELSIPAVKSLLVRARENVRGRIEPYLRTGANLSEKRGTA